MENHQDILKTLQTVLMTELLAPSMSALAKKLGYTGRNSLYRILKGEAGQASVDTLISRLETHLNTDVYALLRMEAAINNAADFNRLIKPEFRQDYPQWQYQAILTFIIRDYSNFSPDFQNGNLRQILLFERNDPRAFHNMLAWFYIKSLGVRFYDPRQSHRERCAAIMEPLGERLKDIFPGNGLALAHAYAYSLSEIYNSETQNLWSLVESMGAMLAAFASPIGITEKDCGYRLIPGIANRTYWQGSDPDKALLMWIRPGREPGIGHYELFSVCRRSGSLEGVASIYILSEEIASVFTKRDSNSRMAMYRHDGKSFSFEWEKPDADPMQTGNRWTFLPRSASQSLRELDRSLTDDALTREMARSEGFEYDSYRQPADVIMSRQKLTLVLKDGSRYAFDIDSAPFLRDMNPNEPMMICRQMADGRDFAIWPEIRQSIPLDLFDPTTPHAPCPSADPA